MLSAEQRTAERVKIFVLWAIGDEDGPLAQEVKIGFSTQKQFRSDVVYRMRSYRSRPLAHHAEVYINGEGAALRLMASVTQRLKAAGCALDKPDWFKAAGIVDGVVTECAASEGVRLMTPDEAKQLHDETLERELATVMRRFE